MDIQIENPESFALLLIAAATVLLFGYSAFARARGASRFATSNLAREILPSTSRLRRWVGSMMVVASLLLLALALVDIRWGKLEQEVPQKGIEVMFVLDVSRSMLAEDVTPSRLERAKQQIRDMLDEMSGDRAGLLVFAGETRQEVPLTSHYEDFKQTLDEIGPNSLNRGGSKLGDAIRAASDAFMDKTRDHKAMVIFTDGEDQESKPIDAAQQAYTEKGIRIFTVGLGDIVQGARIPNQDRNDRDQYIEYDGQAVWSKLNGETLSQIATDTEGAYIPAGTKRVNMADVYHGYIASVEQTEFDTAKISAHVPRFQWFAIPALFLVLLEVVLSTAVSRTSQGASRTWSERVA
jgi:Ca-activated chloride channel homolog